MRRRSQAVEETEAAVTILVDAGVLEPRDDQARLTELGDVVLDASMRDLFEGP